MWKCLACAVLIAATTAVPTAARAEPSSTEIKLAEELAQQAFEAYSKGDFVPAIALYKKAYQNSPSGVILFNIANIFDKKLKDKEQALEYYRRYLRSNDSEPELVKRASERIDIVRAEIDAGRQAQTEDRPATSPSGSPSTSTPSLTATSAPIAPPPPPPEPRSSWKTAGLVVGASGLLAIAISGGLGYEAKIKNDDAEKGCPNSSCQTKPGLDASNSAHRYANWATGVFVGGALAVVGGVGLYVYGPRKENRMNNNKVSIRITPQLGGLAISGIWQ
jgi:tetratricopeptide (TPR) repeat protein